MIMYLLDKQQNIVQAISDGFLEAKMTEEINTADKLVFSLVQTKRLPSEIYFVCIPATRGDAFLMFKIISESVKDDRIEYTCIESAYDELKSYTYIRDVRPQDKTASEMLQIALANTRWGLGHSEETVRKRTNFYYISTLEAIQKIVELFKIELTFTVAIDPITNRIVRRQVNLYSQQGERTGKRFEYGSNLLSVTREESSEDLVTALVGRGKGEQLDDGNDDTVDGYGRRIMFTDVVWSKANGNPTDKPAGQEYVEDKEATKLYGFDDGKPRIGIAVFEDIEDVNQLINATWAALQVAKRPKVSFKASALDIGDLGLGDTVAIIRHELNIEYFTRVYKVEHDLLDKNNNVIELGDDFSEKSLTNYVASVKQAQEETSRVANIALTSANGKNKNFYSNVKPTTAAEGDNLYLDLDNGETEYYIWRNGNWELILSTAEIKTTQREVDKALEDVEDVRSKANEAYNSAKSAHSTINSIRESFANMQNEWATQLVDIDTRAQLGVQNAVDNITKLADRYDTFTKAINGRIDLSVSESARRIAEVSASTKELSDRAKQQQKAIADLTTSIDGVRGQYAALDGRVSQFSAGIDGLNTQLRDAKGQLAAIKVTADGTATNLANAQGDIANVRAKANLLEQQMLGKVGNDVFESFRSSTAQALNSKLTASDLNGYARSSEVEQTANGLRGSITSVEGKLNNFSVGGRNLLKQSQLGSKHKHDAWYEAFGGVTWNSDTVELNVGDKDCVQIEQRVYNIEPDTDYVFSFDLNYADGQHLDRQGFIFWEFKDRECKQTTNVYKDNWTNMVHLPNTPGRRDKEIVIHTQPDTHTIIFMVRSLKGAKLPFRISKVKFEKGNKPTDWSPAPDDFNEQLSAVNNTLQLYNTEFNLLKDGMTLRINEIIKVNDRINGLKVGGRNYLQGSLDFTWPTGIGQLNVTPTFEMQGDTKVAHLNSRDFGGIYTRWGGAFPNGELQVGDDYTLSFDARGTGNFKVVKNESEVGDGTLSGVSLTSDWKRYSVSGKINSLNKAYVIYFNGGYDAYIRHVKIEKGNKATDYTQAPEDIDSKFNSVNNTLKAYKTEFDLLKDGMSLRVAEIDRVNTRINDLNIQNLVYNSEFTNNAEAWTLFGIENGRTILYANNEWDTYKGSTGLAFRNTIGGYYNLSATSKSIRVTQYDKLSASVWMHVTDNITNGNCKARMEIVFFSEESTGYLSSSDQATQEVRNIRNGHQQLLYCNDVRLPSGTRYVALRLSTNGVGNIIFNQPMLTFSESYVPYTQNTGLLETLPGRYSSLNVRVDSINSMVAHKADKSYVDQRANEITAAVSDKASWAYVNQKAKEISSVVANKADASYVDQKANQWQLILQNMQIGGTNLLKGTSKDFHSINAPTTGWIDGIRYDTSRSLDKNRYTLSFEAKASYNGQKMACYLWHGDLGGDNRVRGVIESNGVERDSPVDGYWEVTLTNSWKKYYITYKLDPDDRRKSVIIGRRFANSSTKPIGSVYVRYAKLEEGTKATDWSPDPEDTTVAITAVKNELTQAINMRVQKGDMLSQLNIEAGRTLIQSKKIYLDADSVVFSGRAFIPSAAITSLNADKITTGTLNASNVNIINLNVSKLTGDKTEFVRSFWRSAYGSYVNIDYSGMRVTYGNTTTQFYDHGMLIQAVGEKIGGIGWQGMQGMPSNYQGLLFWLDGGGDYMAWAARDNGNYSMNPQIKMSWYRNEWRPNSTDSGFNFYDPVTFNEPITLRNVVHPSGNPSDGMAIRFFTVNYNGHSYPTIGSKSMKAGIMIGDWDLFLLFNSKVYPLQGWKVPTNLDQGRIARYLDIEY